MGLLSEQWRKRAEELNGSLPPLLQSVGVVPAQITAVKAVVLPELLLNMADMLDVLETQPTSSRKTVSARERMERNALIRNAATLGDWDAIDRILDDAVAIAVAKSK